MHVSSDLLTERAENFELDDSPAQPGIKKSHCWQVSDCDVVFSSLSNALPQRICYKVGDWVVVIYDNVEYPGKVTVATENDNKVNVMHRNVDGMFN